MAIGDSKMLADRARRIRMVRRDIADILKKPQAEFSQAEVMFAGNMIARKYVARAFDKAAGIRFSQGRPADFDWLGAMAVVMPDILARDRKGRVTPGMNLTHAAMDSPIYSPSIDDREATPLVLDYTD